MQNNFLFFFKLTLKKWNVFNRKIYFPYVSTEIELRYIQNTSSIKVQPLVDMLILKSSNKCLLQQILKIPKLHFKTTTTEQGGQTPLQSQSMHSVLGLSGMATMWLSY